MKISIVIATHFRSRLLAAALDSLAEQEDPDFEVIVMCDGEDPGTRRLSESLVFPAPVTWIFNPEVQYQARARNAGAAAATGDLLLFLDDDATAAPGWISHHRRRHSAGQGSRKFLVIGRTIHVYQRPPNSKTEQLLRQARERRDQRYVSSLGNPDRLPPETLDLYSVCGFNCSIRRDVFLASGGYDPRIHPRYEDVELGHRLLMSGVETLTEPEAVLYHHDTKDLVEESATYWRHSGTLAAYRMNVKSQRSAQFAWIAGSKRADPIRRLKVKMSWEHPQWIRLVSRIARELTDRTGSERALRLWQRFASPVESWQAMKDAQITLDSLGGAVGAPLLVLALHDIQSDPPASERSYTMSPGGLRRLLDLLQMLGFGSVTAAEGLHGLVPRRYVLTFDGAYAGLYSEVFPLAGTDSIQPLVFVVTGQIGGFNAWDSHMAFQRRRILSADQIREMHRHGFQFGSLTSTHPWLPTLSECDLEREVCESKHQLEDLLGAEVPYFAYPYGGANTRVRAAVARAGYQYAFSTSPGLSYWDHPFWVRRVEVSDDDGAAALILKALTGRSLLQHAEPWVRRLTGTPQPH